MGFFSELREDLSQAVSELMSEEEQKTVSAEELLEQIEKENIPRQEKGVNSLPETAEDLGRMLDSMNLEDLDLGDIGSADMIDSGGAAEYMPEDVPKEPAYEQQEEVQELFVFESEDAPEEPAYEAELEPESVSEVSAYEPELEPEAPVYEPELELEAPVYEPELEPEAPVYEPELVQEMPAYELESVPDKLALEPKEVPEIPSYEQEEAPEIPAYEPELEPKALAYESELAPEVPIYEQETPEETKEEIHEEIVEKQEEVTEVYKEEVQVEETNYDAMGTEGYGVMGDVADETAVITAGMKVRGDISSQGSLDIIGTVEGNIDVLGKLNITGSVDGASKAADVYAEKARINGDVQSSGSIKIGQATIVIGNIFAMSAVIAGAVKGDIDVKGPVILDTSAIVMGNIKSKSVQINNGAVIEGLCSQCYADVSPSSFFEDIKKARK